MRSCVDVVSQTGAAQTRYLLPAAAAAGGHPPVLRRLPAALGRHPPLLAGERLHKTPARLTFHSCMRGDLAAWCVSQQASGVAHNIDARLPVLASAVVLIS